MADALSGAGKGAAAGVSIAGPVGAGIGALVGGIGSFLGGHSANKAKQKALQDYLAQLQQMGVANPEDYVADYQQLDPDQLQQYQAVQEQNIATPDTALAGIQTDPALRQAQQQALAKMQQIGNEGLSVSDMAARDQLLGQVGTQERGAQDAITQEMQRRGLGGSGADLAAKIASAQGAYGQAAQQGEQLAAERDQRAKEAVLQSGQMAGNLETADYQKAQNLANAKDLINKFNTQNALGVQQQNAANQQNASNSNVGQANNATMYNNQLANQQAQQRVTGTLGNINAQNQKTQIIGNTKLGQGDLNAQKYQNIGNAAAKGGSALGDFVSKYGGGMGL